MHKIYVITVTFVTLVACQPFRLTRIGYENFRKIQDTTCSIRIIEPGAGIPAGEKVGRILIEPRLGNRNRSKRNAIEIAKADACAIHANTIYIVQEEYRDDDAAKAYSCIIDMYKDSHTAAQIPDFVKRAQAEARAAKEQRDRLDEIKSKLADTVAAPTPIVSVAIDSLPATSLRRYSSADSVAFVLDQDAASLKQNVAMVDRVRHDPVDSVSFPVKEKLKKGLFATIGHHYGGATIAGLELEAAVWRIGIMGGVGVFGYCYGVNLHLTPDPLSSYVSCLYWQNGIYDYARQSVAGIAYNYRGKRWLSMQLGLGKILDKGPEFTYFNDNFMLLYSLGAYVPF